MLFIVDCEELAILPYLPANKLACQVHGSWQKTRDTGSETKDFLAYSTASSMVFVFRARVGPVGVQGGELWWVRQQRGCITAEGTQHSGNPYFFQDIASESASHLPQKKRLSLLYCTANKLPLAPEGDTISNKAFARETFLERTQAGIMLASEGSNYYV